MEKVTKLGVGVYSSGGGHILDALLRMEPTVILLIDPDPNFAREVRRWFPKAFLVGRRFFPSQPLDDPERRGREAADFVAQLAVPLRGVINAWMSYNERVGHRDYPLYEAYNRFQAAFARQLQGTYGIDAIAANDGPRSVDAEDYPRYFADAIRESRYFGVHAYSPLYTSSMKTGADDAVLYYRKIHQALAQAGLAKPYPYIVITESGLVDGWQGVVSAEQMAEEFVWYTNELYKDPYVIGHAIYGIFEHDNERWRTFNLYPSSILDMLGRYQPPAQ